MFVKMVKSGVNIVLLNLIFSGITYAGKNAISIVTGINFEQQQVHLSGNNIGAWFQNEGIFNRQKSGTLSQPGFEWPLGSGKTACYTSGISISGYVNGQLTQLMASYAGEYYPGIIISDSGVSAPYLKMYSISRGDSAHTNPDYANWYLIVPLGAPFVDVNQNGQYDPGIDIPGINGASQTIFVPLTGGFVQSRNSGSGFGGGVTSPLMLVDLRLTAWSYDIPSLEDVQFVKWDFLNQSSDQIWERLRLSVISDPDVGEYLDDYIGCDTILKIGYGYNAFPNDGNGSGNTYGSFPPAFGQMILQGPVMNGSAEDLSFTSFATFMGPASTNTTCQTDPVGDPRGAHLFMSGYKKDSTLWVNKLTGEPTKYLYSGDPESSTGWTEFDGSILNCNGKLTGQVVNINPTGDRRFIINSGSDNFIMSPGDTQTLVAAQLMAQGENHLNSVTKLKEFASYVRELFSNGFIYGNSISGMVRFIDNNQPVSDGIVKVMKLDKVTGNIDILASTPIGPNGQYLLPNVPIDSVYIVAYPNSKSKADFIPGYYPSSLYWSDAIMIYPITGQSNVNISVTRSLDVSGSNSVSGHITATSGSTNFSLKDAIVIAKSVSGYIDFGITPVDGTYDLIDLPNGEILLIADRIGFDRDSVSLSLNGNTSLNNINLLLHQVYASEPGSVTELPFEFRLYQNFPNPFNPNTTIKFELSQSETVKLRIFDMLGREVAFVPAQLFQAGVNEFTFVATGLTSGVYFYEVSGRSFREVKRMVLLR